MSTTAPPESGGLGAFEMPKLEMPEMPEMPKLEMPDLSQWVGCCECGARVESSGLSPVPVTAPTVRGVPSVNRVQAEFTVPQPVPTDSNQAAAPTVSLPLLAIVPHNTRPERGGGGGGSEKDEVGVGVANSSETERDT